MSQVTQTPVERKEESEILHMCKELFNEWLHDLNLEEKEIWLWNANVQMLKIKQRRKQKI